MCLQYKEPILNQYDPLIYTELVQKNKQSITISLPKIRSASSNNKHTRFKEYQSGTKIINQLPLLIFQSLKKPASKSHSFQRYKTSQNYSSRFDTLSPFFKNHISRSLQKRQLQRNLPIQLRSEQKKSLVQVVSLDSISIKNRTQSPKISPKHLIIKKSEITIHRHETTPESNKLGISLECSQIKKKSEPPLGQKKSIRLTKKQTNRFQKQKRNFGSERYNTISCKEQDVSPWKQNTPREKRY